MSNDTSRQQVALVTGATSGIGKATALGLAARGLRTIVHGRDRARGGALVAQIRERGGQAELVTGDLADAAAVRRVAEESLAIGGGAVDVLVNNAGVFPFGATAAATPEQIDTVLAINVRAPFLLVGLLAPGMAERGRGAIVNVTTMAASRVVPGAPLYGASKAALATLTRYWAGEYGARGVRVNSVSPGPTRTEGAEPFGEGLDQLGAMVLLRRVASPAEIAAAVIYLATEDSPYVQGATLDVDGGYQAA